MPQSRLILVGTCIAGLLSLSQCSAPTSEPTPGTGGSSSTAGTTGSAGSGSGGSTGAAGTSGTGNSSGAAGNPGSGGSSSTAGSTGSGGSVNPVGSGGSGNPAGHGGSGNTAGSGGSSSTAGATGTAGSGAAGRGGSTGGAAMSTGGTSAGGSTGQGGSAGTGVRMDQGGVPLAKPGDTTNVSGKYLNLGDMRLINNRWGSDAQGCNGTQQSVFINSDKTAGYNFTRGACDSTHAHPDFPEIEFGVAPFGTTNSLRTTPAFSSTTLLPIQIKNITTATVNIDSFNTSFTNPGYYDNNFEFWISKNDPRTSADGGVYAEVIAFTGWQSNRLSSNGGWPCDKSGNTTAGTTSYTLCHQSDDWSTGHWRFFNFNVSGGPFNNFITTADIKAMLNWIMSNYSGFTGDMWLTRIEVGTEVDDNTAGAAKIKNLTFNINGTTKSFELAQ